MADDEKKGNGKTYVDKDGYRRFVSSDDLVHKWVAKKKYSNERLDGKEIHHIDGNKLNNSPENLLLLHKDDHFAFHKHQRENKGRILRDWAYVLLWFAVFLQVFCILSVLPTFWIPYASQFRAIIFSFSTMTLLFVVLFGGVKRK